MNTRRTCCIFAIALLSGCATAPRVDRWYSTTDPDVPGVVVNGATTLAASYHPDGSPVEATDAQRRAAAKPALSPSERSALRIFGWCSAADAASTLFALHRGAVELNPLLGPNPSAGALVASKLVWNAAAHALIVHGDGDWAPVVRTAGWLQCGAAAWNIAIAGSL